MHKLFCKCRSRSYYNLHLTIIQAGVVRSIDKGGSFIYERLASVHTNKKGTTNVIPLTSL